MALESQNTLMQAEIPAPPPTTQVKPQVNVSISTDAILIFGVLIWALWDKIMKPQVVDKLDGVFAPVQEERRLTNILAQIGIISRASRIVLAAFHNGSLDTSGYHLQKLSTVNAYTSPGSVPMAYPIRDLPIGRIMFEIEEMLKTDGWVCVTYDESLPQSCRDHLIKNNIHRMCNRLVKVGNLPIGILSIQYSDNHADAKKFIGCDTEIIEPEHQTLMDDLYLEISSIMRRRVIHPSPIHKVFGTILGTIKVKK